MSGPWISAQEAKALIGNTYTLCDRLHAGLIPARARLLIADDQRRENALIGNGFWWAGGHEALEQDWQAGDFSTWLDEKYHVQAFGVEMELGAIIDLLPPEQRGEVARRHSVAGNPDWVSANMAVRMIAPMALRPARHVESQLIEAARQGFVAARSVEALGASRGFSDWKWQEREWDVPRWFWDQYTLADSSSCNFEQNTMRGRGRGPIATYMQLNGLHFFHGDLVRHFQLRENSPDHAEYPDKDGEEQSGKPRLPEPQLQAWWNRKRDSAEGLTQDELLLIARAKFPAHSIARDRIRSLTVGRKSGPKPIGG